MQRLPRSLARILAIAAILAATGCASMLDEDGALTVVPYRIGSAGHIIVEVDLNDQGPFRFAFDTGASISVVFDDTREKIGLEPLTGENLVIQGMVGSGTFPVARVEAARIGSEIWRDARVACMPGDTPVGAQIHGVLGVDFLRRYAVGFSVRERVLRFYPPELVSARAYRGWLSIPMRRLEIGVKGAATYAINLTIGERTIPAMLDLGAQPNVMNWRAARVIGVRPVAVRDNQEVAGAVGTALVATQLDVSELTTGDLRWTDKTFLIADLPVFDALDLDHRPVAIVGSELFIRRDFVLDFQRNRLLVRAGAADRVRRTETSVIFREERD